MKIIKISALILIGIAYCAGAEGNPNDSAKTCGSNFCLFIEYDNNLHEEAWLLSETLRLRLCSNGVEIPDPDPSDKSIPSNENSDNSTEQGSLPENKKDLHGCPNKADMESVAEPVWWIVHLNETSNNSVLLAMDHMGERSSEDLIRELIKGPYPRATAWTIALTIEEAISPYLEVSDARAPLGAGLAVIEPPAVGGSLKKKTENSHKLLMLKFITAGLDVAYLGVDSSYMDDFIVGPRASIQSLAGPHFLVSFSAGWMGTGNLEKQGSDDTAKVEGTVSYVPLELLFGFSFTDSQRLNLIIVGGLSGGFSIYKFSSSEIGEKDSYLYFNPLIELRAEASFNIYGPLAVYLGIGASFPFVRDSFTNSGDIIYTQDWIMPLFGIGIKFENVKN